MYNDIVEIQAYPTPSVDSVFCVKLEAVDWRGLRSSKKNSTVKRNQNDQDWLYLKRYEKKAEISQRT